MRRNRYLTLFSLSILWLCCKYTSKNTATTNEKELINIANDRNIEILNNAESILDTIKIDVGLPHIIAFSLTQNEYDKLSDIDAGEYDEGYGDMIFYLDKFAEKVKYSDLLIKETASRYIKVGKYLIDRKKFKFSWGLIFISKSGKFEIVNNGLIDTEISEKSKSFLGLKL